EDWDPVYLPSLGEVKEASNVYATIAQDAAASKLDPKSRGAILGETALPAKSVFDYMTPAARERVAALSGRKNLPPALGQSIPSDPSSASSEDKIPKLDKQV